MKKSAIFCAIVATMIGTYTMCANTNGDEINTCSMTREAAAPAITEHKDGMFFDVRGVMDNICYGDENDGAWYLVYDDADAGMYYEIIRVTKATYDKVLAALENGNELYGTLKATKEYESIEYELQVEVY